MSLRNAINAKCKDCIYDPLAGLGQWREQVEHCPCTDCPLHAVRPRSGASRALSARDGGESTASAGRDPAGGTTP